MDWSYTGNPASDARDEIRFLVGDTDANDPLLSDQEVAYLLTVRPNSASTPPTHNYYAAADAAGFIASKFARLVDKTAGSLSVSLSQKYERYKDLAKELRTLGATSGRTSVVATPIAGGLPDSTMSSEFGQVDRFADIYGIASGGESRRS